jgi:magnesium chelatase family protein
MRTKLLHLYCAPDRAGEIILKNAMEKPGLSARAYDRILKVARTIADLEGAENCLPDHLGEAINYQSLDREG